MADLSDVSTALVTTLQGAIYPSGLTGSSAVGTPVYVYPGWPEATALDAHLAAGAVDISVFPQPGTERVTTRYPKEWQDQTRVAPTVTAAASGRIVTIGGAVTAGNYVAIIADGQPFAYAALAGDTPPAIAAALVALINPVFPVTVVGGVITFGATMAGRVAARSGAAGTLIRELRRQQRGWMMTIWAPSDALRSAVANLVDPILSGLDFLTMPDRSAAWMTYRTSNQSDEKQTIRIYRRDLVYAVEYATTETMVGYPITAFQTTFQPANPMGNIGSAIVASP